jgi:hypothetical protein
VQLYFLTLLGKDTEYKHGQQGRDKTRSASCRCLCHSARAGSLRAKSFYSCSVVTCVFELHPRARNSCDWIYESGILSAVVLCVCVCRRCWLFAISTRERHKIKTQPPTRLRQLVRLQPRQTAHCNHEAETKFNVVCVCVCARARARAQKSLI